MTDTQKVHSSAQTTEAPGVKPKHPGGRKPKGYYERGVQDRLNGLAPDAVTILDHHIHQRKGYKTIKDSVLKSCWYIIDHAIGKARQKIEHSGGVLTYSELAKSAEALEKKPREVLADAEEIAHKYQENTTA